MDWLKAFDLELWWRAMIAVGLVLIGAALAANDRGVLILGFGLVAVGFGEWLNRPRVGSIELSWYEWRPCISGLVLDAIGLALIAFGLWKVLVA